MMRLHCLNDVLAYTDNCLLGENINSTKNKVEINLLKSKEIGLEVNTDIRTDIKLKYFYS
jgi:hypothetical protein